jgi:hypothetical protein
MQSRRGFEPAAVDSRLSKRAVGLTALAFGVAMLLWIAPRASAGDTLFWSNYSGDTLAFANIDGSGGGAFNPGSATVKESEGLTIDSAGGTLIWTNTSGGPEDKGGIFFANLDGSGGGGPLNTGAATVNAPNAIALDPGTRTVFWSNYKGGPENKGTISFAKLDGSSAGDLNTSGAVVAEPEPIAIDTAGGKIYWGNSGGDKIYFANLTGGGGGQLDTSGAPVVNTPSGLAIDPVSGRLFWSSSGNETISFAALSGGGGGSLATTGVKLDNPYGLALDPAAARLYVGNYGLDKERLGAIASIALSGGGVGLNVSSAPVNGAQNPIILRAPSAASPPTVTGKPKFHSVLTCSTGAWAADFAGSYLYQAPHTYAYQWTRDGVAIAGATASTFKINSAGSYACAVTAANQAGSAVQSSPPLKVKPAKLQIKVTTRKVIAEPGGDGVFKLAITNKGGVPTKGHLCAKAPKKAKQALETPKCAALGKVNAGKKRTAKLRVKVKPGAGADSYKITFKVTGGSGKSSTSAKLIVEAAR